MNKIESPNDNPVDSSATAVTFGRVAQQAEELIKNSLATASQLPANQQHVPIVKAEKLTLYRRIKRFLHIELPYSVTARGITLYLLWQHDTLPLRIQYVTPSDFQSRQAILGMWPVTHIFQQSQSAEQDSRWLNEQELGHTIERLLETLQRHVAGGTAYPAYVILHIQELKTWKPRFYFFPLYTRKRRIAIDRYAIDRQKATVETLQMLISSRLTLAHSQGEFMTFEHYDRSAQRRGWLTFAPAWALLAGVDREEARIIASIVQPRDTAREGGIIATCYEDVLQRVIQWNSTQDFFEAVNQVAEVAMSGKKSTNGQLWLNFALAAIGIVLALSGVINVDKRLMAYPLGLFALASVLHALYASYGKGLIQFLGIALFMVASVVTIIWLFEPPWLQHFWSVIHSAATSLLIKIG